MERTPGTDRTSGLAASETRCPALAPVNRRLLWIGIGLALLTVFVAALVWVRSLQTGEAPPGVGPARDRFEDVSQPASNAGLVAVPSPVAPTRDAAPALDAVLRADLPEDRKAEELLRMVPSLPPAVAREALVHALNLLPDERFSSAQPWLERSAPRAMGQLVISEIANRPDAVKLPLLIEILRLPDHPLRAEARLLLLPYVGIARVDDPEAAARAVAERLAR
mgnify:CR=1 FL=1